MPEYHFEAAKCYANNSDFLLAIDSVKSGIELDSSLAIGWSLLGIYTLRIRDIGEACVALQKAHELNPKSQKYALDYGYALLLSGKLQKARSVLSEIRIIDSKSEIRRSVLMAESWVREENIKKAIDQLKITLKDFPNSPEILGNLSKLQSL